MLEIGTSGLMSGERKRVAGCQPYRASPRLYSRVGDVLLDRFAPVVEDQEHHT